MCVMLALAVLVSTPVYAQVSGATLAGTVMDASGAVIANAKVSIRNTATDVTRDITTDSSARKLILTPEAVFCRICRHPNFRRNIFHHVNLPISYVSY